MNVDGATTSNAVHTDSAPYVLPLHCDNSACVDPGDGVEFVSTYRLNRSYDIRSVVSCLSGVYDNDLMTGVLIAVAVDNPSDLVRHFNYFTVNTLKDLCHAHLLPHSRRSKSLLALSLASHICSDACAFPMFVVFAARRRRRLPRRDPKLVLTSIRTRTTTGTAVVPDLHLSSQVEELEGNFPYVANRAERYDIIREWQTVMDPSAWTLKPCAVCAQCKYDGLVVHARELPLNLLRNIWLPAKSVPTTYNWEGYDRAILYPLALRDRDAQGELDICRSCFRDLKYAGRQPLDSLANFQYFGIEELPCDARRAFERASMFDVMLVARARASRITHLFSSAKDPTTRGGDPETSQRYNRGNVAILTQDNVALRQVLPPPREEVAEAMCALFVGGSVQPTRDNIMALKPVLVSKNDVSAMLDFLLSENRWYKNFGVTFSESNMAALFDGQLSTVQPQVPAGVEIYHLPNEVDVERSGTDYTGRQQAMESPDDGDLVMEAVGYVCGDRSPQNYNIMKASALAWCLDRKRFLKSCTGSVFLHDQDPLFMSSLFPHLDPWGIGGFHAPERTPEQRLSFEHQLRNLLRQHNSPFQKDPTFAFVCWNILQKMEVNRHGSFRVKEGVKHTIVRDIKEISPTLSGLIAKWNFDPHARPCDAAETKAIHVLRKIHLLVRDLKGTAGYKQSRRNEIRALMKRFGTPALFITLNPCDIQHVLVGVLGGLTPDAWRGMTTRERAKFVATHPGPAAQFFDIMITRFLNIILRFGRDKPGLFGTCNAYYGMVEAQGRGTLHCHMLVWLEGNLSPQALRDRMAADSTFTGTVISWLESVIHCHLPGMTEPLQDRQDNPLKPPERPQEHVDPRLAVPPMLRDHSEAEFEDAFQSFVAELAIACNWHVHTATCWKHLNPGEPRDDAHCRMRIDGTTRSMTEIDPETQSLLLKKLHPRINNFNDLVLFLVQCNMDIKFIGSGEAAKALVYYVTDYITKNSLAFHVGFAAIQHAIAQNGHKFLSRPDAPMHEKDRSLYIKTVNSIMARQEMSHQQIMSYLIGGGDFYASHAFRLLRWSDFDRYIAREDVQTQNQTVTDAINWTDNEALGADVEDDAFDQSEDADGVTLQTSDTDIAVRTDILDYVHRPVLDEMERMSLWVFTELYCKIPKSRESARIANKKNNSGRKAGIRGEFASQTHPQFDTHLVRLRSKDNAFVPVLLGGVLPRRDRGDDERELWCRAMLILFKPWRRLSELKSSGMSWVQAYDSNAFDTYCQRIINNIHVENECKDAKNTYENRRRAGNQNESLLTHTPALWGGDISSLETSLLDDGNLDCGEYESDCDDDCRDSDDVGNQHHPLHSHEKAGADVLQTIESTGLFHVIAQSTTLPADVTSGDSSEMVGSDMDAIHRHEMWLKEQRQCKRPALRPPCDDERTKRVVGQKGPSVVMTTLDDRQLHGEVGCEGEAALDIHRIIDHVVLDFGLDVNPEQQRAFRIVGTHVANCSKEQLLLYVGGMGGTGKTHVIRAIVELFKRSGQSDKLMLSAPTGCAAVLINGYTIHSLTLLPSSKKVDVKVLEAVWRHIRYLVIDEISMIGATLLSQISQRIGCARGWDPKSSECPFGGINVIFTGDFGQLRPVQALSLYSHSLVETTSEKIVQNEHGQYALHGAAIWRQVTKVVELKINQRAAGDPAFTNLLCRVRLGRAWDGESAMDEVQRGNGSNYEVSDFMVLQNRQLKRLPFEEVQRFRYAPIVVSTKSVRDALNMYLTTLHAARCQQEVQLYHSEDRFDKRPLADELQSRMWRVSSSVADDALGRLPLFPGQKVMVTENVAINVGIVNGTECVIKDIKYKTDLAGRRYGVCAFVHAVGSGVHLDDLDADIVPIVPTRTSFRYTGSDHIKYTINRSQFPLLPAYSYTDYKSQGRSIPEVLLDLAECRSLQSLYVMLSRATSLKNLAIVRWFSPAKLYEQRLSEECRNELTRLQQLDETTLREFEWSSPALRGHD